MQEPLTKIIKRIQSLEEWINQNGKGCKQEQAHLSKDSKEKIYWNYGYLIALKDMLALLTNNNSSKFHKPGKYN